MIKLLLDANIFSRFITADGPAKQLKTVRHIFGQIQNKQYLASVHSLTLHEVIYVGIHVYKLDKTSLVAVLEQLLSLENLEVYDLPKQVVVNALKLFKQKNIDWPDCLLAKIVEYENNLELRSFDQDFAGTGLKNKSDFSWLKK
jgi:predicted nucleic acid-binding protein